MAAASLRGLPILLLGAALSLSACAGVADKHSTVVRSVQGSLLFGGHLQTAAPSVPSPPAAPGAAGPPGTLGPPRASAGGLLGLFGRRGLVPSGGVISSAPNETVFNLFPPGGGSGGGGGSGSGGGGSGGGITCPTPPTPDPTNISPATPDIQGMPSPGHYATSAAGTLVRNGSSSSINEQLTRAISDVTNVTDPTNSGAFSYQYQGGLAYQVVDPAMAIGLLVKPAQTGAPLPTGAPTSAPLPSGVPTPAPLPSGASADGVFLSALSLHLGGSTFSFTTPVGGAQLLPLPAANGLSWQSAAADPVDGSTVQFSGSTNASNGEELVDVCGQWVEAWRVDGTLTLTSPGVSLVDQVILDIATQDGGLLIADRHSITSGGGLAGTSLAAVLDTMVPS